MPLPVLRRLAVVALALLGLTACGGSEGAPPPRPAQSAVVWAVGDADGDQASAVTGQIARSGRVDRVLYLGDIYEDGFAEDFRRFFAPAYGRFGRRLAPTPGNHEWENRDEGYLPYWQRVTGRPIPPWYSFRSGGWTS